MAYPLQNLNIDWDFSANTKSKYFNDPILVSGDYCISFCDNLLPFYEICTQSDSTIYIDESVRQKPIFLDGVTKPLLYIRNIGNFNLTVCSADQSQDGLHFDYEAEKINKKYNCSFSNFILRPKENVILNLQVDQNGSCYFSSGNFDFGYFYKITNLAEKNPCGLFPICCVNEQPIFKYQNLSGINVDYIDCGNNNFCIENYESTRSYESPSNSENYFSLLIENNEFVSIPSGANGSNCFDILSGNFNFQTWFNVKKTPTQNENISVAYIDSTIPYVLLGFRCDRILVGSGDSCFYDLCYNTDVISFDALNNGYAGVYTDNCSGAYLPSNEFTIEFFSKNDCLAGSSFLKFDGIELNLAGGFAPLILGNCQHIWDTGCYVRTGEWQHFAITKTNQCIRVYVDYCCVFGACNTCCFTISNNSPNYIGCGLIGCIHSFRYLKNQSLYSTDCISRILPPLSCSGFVNCNQNITGDILFLGLTGGQLDSGWYDMCVDCVNSFIPAILICENYECGFFIKTGLKLNEWNHFALDIYNCTGSIFINGDLKCIFSGFNCDGILMPISGTNKLIIGNKLNIFDDFNGLLSHVQYTNTNTNHPFGSNFSPCISGFTNTGHSDLSLDFNWICNPIFPYKEFSTSSLVDNEINLILAMSGCNSIVNTGINSSSKFGQNEHIYLVSINCLHLYCNDNFLCFVYPTGLNFHSGFFSTIIDKNTDICILYDINFSSEKIYLYKYNYSGISGDSNQNLILSNAGNPCSIILFSGCCIIEPLLNYSFTGNSFDRFYLNFNLNSGFSISDLKTKSIDRNCLFLPSCELFPYSYCYELANISHCLTTGISGQFVNSGCTFSMEEFLNCSNVLSCNDQVFIDNKPIDYYLCLNYCDNRFCTNSILCKGNSDISEFFVPIIGNSEKSYFYSGLEYRYYPVCCILYKDLVYEIPESTINITLMTSGNSTNLDFPIQALSLDKLKIISNSEIYERICSTNLNLSYSGIEFNFTCLCSNLICFYLPKIYNNCGNCFESPTTYMSSCYDIKIEDSVTLYLDPYSKFNLDRYYGLNNMLFFIINELNCGSIHECNYCDFSYGSSDYNFLMIDLENNFYDYCMQIPSGSGSFVIDQKISCRNSNSINPFPYKLKSGDGYSYVLPIVNCLQFVDCFINCESGALCSERVLNSNLNFLTTGFNYSGGATGEIYIYNSDGTFLNIETGFLQNSNVSILPNNFSIIIDAESIKQTSTGRSLSFSKNYVFSGVQPIKFTTNYPLLDIKDPIYTTNLMQYCNQISESGLNDFYYFVYDIGNFQEKSIKFLSPDLTYISCMSWSDSAGQKSVLFSDNFNSEGKIQNNAGYIKYCLGNLISSNPYYLCFSESNAICIEIRGGIL
jgi:hypothetical protein